MTVIPIRPGVDPFEARAAAAVDAYQARSELIAYKVRVVEDAATCVVAVEAALAALAAARQELVREAAAPRVRTALARLDVATARLHETYRTLASIGLPREGA